MNDLQARSTDLDRVLYHDLVGHYEAAQTQIRLLRERAEKAERERDDARTDVAALLAGKTGLQDYLRLVERHRDALNLIAKHEITIANLRKQMERISRYDLDRNDPLADCAMRQFAKHALEWEAGNA